MILKNNNICLRPISETDIDQLVRNANNKNVADGLRDYFPHPYDRNDAREYIEMISNLELLSNFAIVVDDEFAGMIGFVPQTDVYRYTGELGYWIGEDYWGKGIVTKSLIMLINYAFDDLNYKKLIACVFGYNSGSMRVLEKAGFEREGVIKDQVFKHGKFYDEVRFGLINPNFKFSD